MKQLAELLAVELSETASSAAYLGVPAETAGMKTLTGYATLLRAPQGSGAAAAFVSNLAQKSAALEGSAGIGTAEIMGMENLPADMLMTYRSPSGKLLLEITPTGSVWDEEFLHK